MLEGTDPLQAAEQNVELYILGDCGQVPKLTSISHRYQKVTGSMLSVNIHLYAGANYSLPQQESGDARQPSSSDIDICTQIV